MSKSEQREINKLAQYRAMGAARLFPLVSVPALEGWTDISELGDMSPVFVRDGWTLYVSEENPEDRMGEEIARFALYRNDLSVMYGEDLAPIIEAVESVRDVRRTRDGYTLYRLASGEWVDHLDPARRVRWESTERGEA